jgi:4-alpha-glucanotransferase
MRLLVLESSRQRDVVVAEDLGTVPGGFRERLGRDAVMGMRVLWFEREAGSPAFTPPRRWDAAAAALTTTHDLPTLAGWWRGGDIDWRVKLNPATDEAGDRRGRDALSPGYHRAGRPDGP